MTSFRLLLGSLTWNWRTNLAVVLGVVAATGVITGALLVGDSVRDSLRQMTLDRLGDVDAVCISPRFVRQSLADEVAQAAGADLPVAPAIVMPGALTRSHGGRATRAGNVSVYGVSEELWEMIAGGRPLPDGNSVVLNARAAAQLGAAVGDEVSLIIEIPPNIPRDSLLGDRDQTVTELVLEVSAIAEDASTPGRFGLNPSQQLPLNAFLALDALQQQLGLSEIRPTRRNPIEHPARVNAMFIGGRRGGPQSPAATPAAASVWTGRIGRHKTLQDLGLQLTVHESKGYFALESEQMILESGIADAGARAASELKMAASPVLVYLLNQIGTRPAQPTEPPGYSMYSVAAGIEFAAEPPFGPLEYVAGGPSGEDVASDAVPVVVNDWLAEDLAGMGEAAALIGDDLPVRYHMMGDRGELPEENRTFRVTGVARLAGPADDRGLTPRVEGVTDVESYSDWREPFPLEHDAITDRDDEYWKQYRATPKVFLRLEDAQRLWRSRYGKLTSLRIAPREGQALSDAMDEFTTHFLKHVSPSDSGLIVQPVRWQGLNAAAGTTDFAGLFAGFSFFLIAAAMLLIGLLFRLNVERRVRELGLLAAVGWTPRRVRRLMLAEGLALACAGALLGIVAGVAYGGLMIYGLKTWWNRAIGTQFLNLSVHGSTLLSGAVGGVLVALAAVAWAIWRTRRISTRDLLHGETEPPMTLPGGTRRGGRALVVAVSALLTGGVLVAAGLAGALPASEAFAGLSWRVVSFFVSGIALLVGTLALLAAWLASDHAVAVQGRGAPALARLGARNASRNRGRSLLTACLIAAATFIIAAVAAGKRNPQSEAPDRGSGNGGFLLVAQSSQGVLFDLNTAEGREKLRLSGRDPAETELLQRMYVAPFRMRPGEDASCLNLYQTRLPTILGVPVDVIEKFDREGRFRFAGTPGEHPWKLLEQKTEAGRIPVLGDMNTLMYSLKLGVGGALDVPPSALSGSRAQSAKLDVVGMLDGSVFQGVLLMSEANFKILFPDEVGFRYFLIESGGDVAKMSELLETGLSDWGFDTEPVAERLANFLAVQNTYLSTFQALGGLGLLLGTAGLATVMMRNVLERRSELALLRAVGLRPSSVLQLICWENLLLLGSGLAAGTVSALVAMRPHLAGSGGAVPWRELALLLGAVLAIGMAAPIVAVRNAVQKPPVAELRAEN